MLYEVTITETYEKTIPVEANTTEEAIQIVSHLWEENDAALDCLPFKGVCVHCHIA